MLVWQNPVPSPFSNGFILIALPALEFVHREQGLHQRVHVTTIAKVHHPCIPSTKQRCQLFPCLLNCVPFCFQRHVGLYLQLGHRFVSLLQHRSVDTEVLNTKSITKLQHPLLNKKTSERTKNLDSLPSAHVQGNFGPYLSNRLRFFNSVKSSWSPMSRATKYVQTKKISNFLEDPLPSPLNVQLQWLITNFISMPFTLFVRKRKSGRRTVSAPGWHPS